MAEDQVVTEIVVKLVGVEEGTAQYTAAMQVAQQATDRFAASQAKQEQAQRNAAAATADGVAPMSQLTQGFTSAQRAADNYLSRLDPVFFASQKLGQETIAVQTAMNGLTQQMMKGAITYDEFNSKNALLTSRLSDVRTAAAGLAAGSLSAKDALGTLTTQAEKSGALKDLTDTTNASTRSFGLNKQGLDELRAAAVNSFQAIASGMSAARVATMEGAQAIGAFAQGGTGLSGILSALVSPIGLAVAAVSGLAAGLLILESRYEENKAQLRQFELALQSTVTDAAGTAQKFQQVAQGLRDIGVASSDANQVLLTIARNPLFNQAAVQDISQVVIDLSAALGVKVPDAASKFDAAISGGVDGVLKLDYQVGALTAAQATNILEMKAHGDQAGALNAAIDALTKKIAGDHLKSLGDASTATNTLSGAWGHLLDTLSNTKAFDAVHDALIGIVNAMAAVVSGKATMEAAVSQDAEAAAMPFAPNMSGPATPSPNVPAWPAIGTPQGTPIATTPQALNDLMRSNAGLPLIGGALNFVPSVSGSSVPAVSGSQTLSAAQIYQFAINAGFTGQSAQIITAIALAESGGNPSNINYGDPLGSYGLTQINGAAWGLSTAQSALDPQTALNLAYSISNGGTNFTPWSTFTTTNPSLSYGRYLTAASAAASQYGSGMFPSATQTPAIPYDAPLNTPIPGITSSSLVNDPNGTPQQQAEQDEALKQLNRDYQDAIANAQKWNIEQQASQTYTETYNAAIRAQLPWWDAMDQAQVKADQTRQVALINLQKESTLTDLQTKGLVDSAAAYKQSEVAGLRTAAMTQAQTDNLKTGIPVQTAYNQILERQAADALAAAAKTLPALAQQGAATQQLADAAAQGTAKLHDQQIQNQATAITQDALTKAMATGNQADIDRVTALTAQIEAQLKANDAAQTALQINQQVNQNNNQIQVYQLEAQYAGQTSDEINRQVSLLQAKQYLQGKGLTDQDAEYQKLIASTDALAKAKIAWSDVNADAQRVNSTLTSIGNTIDQDITNNLEAAFDGQKITSWGSIFHSVIAQIEAQLISLSVIKPAIGSVLSLLGFTGAAQSFGSLFSGAGLLSGLGSLFGGSSSSSTGTGQVLKDKDGNVIGTLSNVGSLANSGSNLFGGTGGAFSNITNWLNNSIGPSLGFYSGAPVGDFIGPPAPGLFGTTTLTGALGFAGLGGTIGSLAGLLTGNTGIASTLLSGAGGLVGGLAGGSLLGSILGSAAGPVGAIAGGLLGNIFGGLFGGKPANNESATNINLTNGQVGALSSNGVAQSDQDVQQMASAFSSFVQELLQILPQGTLPGGNIIPQSGTRDGIKVVLGMGDNGENTYSFPDVNTAINSIEQQIIQGLDLSQVGPTLRQVLSTVTDPSQLQAAVQFASAYDNLAQATQTALSSIQGLPQSIQDLKTGVAGPFEQAINQVNSTFATISQQAQQFGLSLDPVNDALAKATATLQGDFKTALQNAYDQSVNGGSDFIDQAKAAFGTFSENQREAGALGIGDDATVIKQNTAIYESALNSIFSALSPTQLQQVQTAFGGIDENLQQLTQSLIAAGGGAAYLAQQTNFAYSVNQDYLNATGQGYLAQLNDLDKTAQAALAQLPTLGLSSSGKEATQIQETEHQSSLTILEGLTPDQLDQARQALDALNPAFDQWIDEAKAAVAATQALTQAQAAQSFQYSAMQDYYNAIGEGFIAQLNDLDKTAQAALAQLPSLGLSPTGIEAQQIQETEHQSALTILEGLNPTQLDQARQALDALNPAFGEWVDEANKAIAATNAAAQAAADQAAAQQQLNNVLQAGAQIRDYLNSLQTGQSAYTSPESALSAAQSQYQTELGLARSGDLTALQGITNAAQALLQASSAYYASSAQGQAIFQEVQADLAALPGVLNASQTQANPVGTITSGNQTIALTGTAATVTDGASAASAQAINAVNDNILTLGNHIDLAGTSTVNAISTGASAVSSHVDQLQGSFDAVRASIDQLRAGWDNFGSTLKSVLAAINNLTAMSAAGFGQIAAGLGAINDNNVASARALVNAIG